MASTHQRRRHAGSGERKVSRHQPEDRLLGRHGELEVLDASIGRIRRMWDLRSIRDWYAARLDLDAVDASLYRTLRAIRLVADTDPSVNGVAGALGVDASTASRFIEQAVSAGCAQRTPSSEDRRRTTVTLTAAGWDRLLTIRNLRVELLDALTEDWSVDEIVALAKALERLDGAIARLPGHGDD